MPETVGPDGNYTGTPTANTVVGDANNNVISTGGARDIVHAAGGDDTVFGGANADRLYGDDGNDSMSGGGSDDKLYGGAGNDTLDGGGDNDRVYGGDGNDVIIGGNGDDVLYGDNPDGNDAEGYSDIFRFDSSDGTDKVFDFEHGVDTVELTSGGSYTLTVSGSNSILTYGTTTVTFYDEILTSADIVVV